MTVTVEKPYVKGSRNAEPISHGVSIAIDLSGAVTGRVKFHFPNSVALALSDGFSGKTHGVISDETKDALREMSNIVVGTAKRLFPGPLTRISTPRVISTTIDEWRHERSVLIIPMTTVAGKMFIEVKILPEMDPIQLIEKGLASAAFNEPEVDDTQVKQMVERLLNEPAK